MASGTVAPEIERVLSSPQDARVLSAAAAARRASEARRSRRRARYQRIGPRARAGGEGSEDQGEPAGAVAPGAREIARRSRRADRAEGARAPVGARRSSRADQQLFKEGLVSQDALRRTDWRSSRHGSSSRSCASERKNAERATTVQLEGLSLERGSLDKEAAQARRLLDLSTTKSDRDGVLTWVVPQEGVLVRRGDVIARIADLTSFRVDATVSDIHSGRLRTGMPAVLRLNDEDLQGTVTEVLPDGRERRAPLHRRARRTLSRRLAPEPPRRRARRHRAQAARAASQARTLRRQRRAPGLRRPRRPRRPRARSSVGARRVSTMWKCCPALSEGDEVIISDMRTTCI